jgi:hypothetical protein
MMKGSGLTDDTYAPPATIPDFSGPDLHFFVEDSGMEGGGWRDTLSSVWNSVKKHVLSNPLAGKVVDAGINKGKQLAWHLSTLYKEMAGLQCICGETFRAQCDLEPAGDNGHKAPYARYQPRGRA